MDKRLLTAASLTVLILSAISLRANAQYDTIAISILDSMAYQIGELDDCNFRFGIETDIVSDKFGLITHTESGEAFLKGPDKMRITKKGDKGYKELYYNGQSLVIYSHDKNQYGSVAVSLGLMELVDSLSRSLGMEFPGFDVFYPDFTDDILANSDNLVYLGLTLVGGKSCYHIAGMQDDMTFQLWISADERPMPAKMSIVYTDVPGNPRYSITYYDWQLNNGIDNAKFDFSAPAGSRQIKIVK